MAPPIEETRGGVREQASDRKNTRLDETSPIVERDGLERLFDTEVAENPEVLALISTFDGRLTEAENRIDRVLARLGIE